MEGWNTHRTVSYKQEAVHNTGNINGSLSLLLAGGWLLLAASWLLLAGCCWLLACCCRCWLDAGLLLLDADLLLLAAGWLLLAASWLLLAGCCWL